MGETLQSVMTGFNRALRVEIRPDRLSGGPGAVLLREILKQSGIVPWMTGQPEDPRRDGTTTMMPMRSATTRRSGWRRVPRPG